jgi:hypothetical protein
MCTLTWLHTADRILLFFNRDEQRTRLPAAPPHLISHHGTRLIAPADGNAGGTWLAANQQGFAVAVLNHYAADATAPTTPPLGHRSRGHLVLDTAALPDRTTALAALADLDLTAYRPFLLTLLDRHAPPDLLQWDGHTRTLRSLTRADLPVTTSSFRSAEVIAARRACFAETVGPGPTDDPARFERFHHSTDPRGGPWSVLMTRPDARTVSYSRLEITPDRLVFQYAARADDDAGGFAPAVTATLKAAA